jgi:hypothetical protein
MKANGSRWKYNSRASESTTNLVWACTANGEQQTSKASKSVETAMEIEERKTKVNIKRALSERNLQEA